MVRAVPRVDALLTDYRTVMAVNFPCNALLGASSTSARKLWCCTEPSRQWHLVATSPHLHARHTKHPTGSSDVERYYARRLLDNAKRETTEGARLVAFDVEMTRKLDVVYSISEFARDTISASTAGATTVIYPMVRFPKGSTCRSGWTRGVTCLTFAARNREERRTCCAVSHSSEGGGCDAAVVGEGPRKRLRARDGLGLSFGSVPATFLTASRMSTASSVRAAAARRPFGMVFPEAAPGASAGGPDHGGPWRSGRWTAQVTDPPRRAS
jgi:hypothetical protein